MTRRDHLRPVKRPTILVARRETIRRASRDSIGQMMERIAGREPRRPALAGLFGKDMRQHCGFYVVREGTPPAPKEAGFTMLELMLSIAIAGVLTLGLIGWLKEQDRRAAVKDPVESARLEQQMAVERARTEHYIAWLEADRTAVANCLKGAGLPIKSGWDGRIKECRK